MPIGRPSKYKPEFCEQVVDLGKQGKSPAQIAAHFDVDRATLYHWSEKHPDFLTALTRAKIHEQDWWETKAMEAVEGDRDFNAQVWKVSMQARFREDYTERSINRLEGPDGGPVVLWGAKPEKPDTK